MIPAVVASIGGASGDAVILALDSTFLAFGNTIRATQFFDVFQAGRIIGEFAIKIVQHFRPFFTDIRFGFHFYVSEKSRESNGRIPEIDASALNNLERQPSQRDRLSVACLSLAGNKSMQARSERLVRKH